ncbi:ABC transporter permease [Pontibacter cellulosilyticus]|uniref:ABC transporter permease n=1 Tax=Pontibacter cellulosilyticus TaxID=1720253 RepID=A0A923N6B0_9BACT|nr:ABC transporter permease [Pontibacter cellulosilyticus]MBC5993705.1 ABC transporter permease [Pontibacter cellulosilyticus]
MLKNYLKMAYRNLMRHKVFSLINISGLALGMTCSILIMLWVKDELSFDQYHSNIDDLYRVMEVQHYPGNDDLITSANPGPLAEALKADLPEVKRAARIFWDTQMLFNYGDKTLKQTGRYVDPEFLQMFSFPLLHGDANQALSQPKSVLLTQEMAENIFGSADAAVGKLLKVDNKESYRVTGVLANVPENSSIQFDFLMPMQDLLSKPDMAWLKEWGNNGIRSYVQLQPGADVAAFNKKIEFFIKKYQEDTHIDLFVQPVADMYLYGDFKSNPKGSGKIETVRLFSVIALFILVIACINFMNLATARSAKRAKEVGVRKAIGASKSALIGQFMVESVLVAFLALFLSLNIAGMVLPQFNELTGKAISFDLSNPSLILLLLGVALFTGLISGSYPALFLSSFNPAVVLKGTVKLNKRVAVFRQGLVVFQFILSALLIISTLVVYLQLHYIRTKDIGMNRDNVVYLPLEGELNKRYEQVKRDLQQVPGITGVSAGSEVPLYVGNSTGNFEWEGKDPDTNILFSRLWVDYHFIETMDIKLKEGRTFSKEFGTDTANYIINEEAARLMQLQNPVGEWLGQDDERGKIIGVVKNFHTSPAQVNTQPIIITLGSGSQFLFARIATGKTTDALAGVEGVIKRHNPAFPFEYHFLDDDYEKIYKSEAIMGKLTTYFAVIAIIISCLGLFGLALFTAEQRTKEIGVRKVLGASVANIVFMLSKDFLKLVLIANLIALPLSWYVMQLWLNGYVYRTEVSWWIFAGTFITTIIIALFTLSFHAVRAAVANPVTSLRTE